MTHELGCLVWHLIFGHYLLVRVFFSLLRLGFLGQPWVGAIACMMYLVVVLAFRVGCTCGFGLGFVYCGVFFGLT